MLLAFVLERFSVRGVEGTVWSYAHYNEKFLNNSSVIIVRPGGGTSEDCTPEARDKFCDRFRVYEVREDAHIDQLLRDLKVDVCIVPCYGTPDSFVPSAVPTIAHCVFRADVSLGTMTAAISNGVSGGRTRVLPNMVDLADSDGTDLRAELGIPDDAFVFGRLGGWAQFSVPWAPEAVAQVAAERPDVWFALMNTRPFPAPPNVVFVPGTCDRRRKRQFINSCDAMVHAREDGETFGCAVGEFAVAGLPVVTCASGDMEHARILGAKAIVCADKDEFVARLRDTRALRVMDMHGNGYERYTPARVIPLLRAAAIEALNLRHGFSGLPLVY
jgi:glycosyltransferase involved in cell wall biosynthesis